MPNSTKPNATKPKKLSARERSELDGLPDEIDRAEADLSQLQSTLADPDLYQRPDDRVSQIRERLVQAEAEIERLGKRWEELEARDSAAS